MLEIVRTRQVAGVQHEALEKPKSNIACRTVKADITALEDGTIVNVANSSFMSGDEVDGN